MKQKRRTTEEIIRILRQAEGGKNVEAVCREHNVMATSYYRWKKKYGGMELQDARRYRELEKENGELKKNTRNRVRGAQPESSRMEAAELDAHALRLLLLRRSDRAQGPGLFLSPFFSPTFAGGRTRRPLKRLPLATLASRSFGQSERTRRTAEHQKKTMKTTAKQNQQMGLLSRSEQLGTENRREIDFALRQANCAPETQKLLALLRSDAPRAYEIAEVVGKWVWIQFSDKQPPTVTSVLAGFGFHGTTPGRHCSIRAVRFGKSGRHSTLASVIGATSPPT